jgi:peptide/nickel transport system permease protein
MRKLADPLIAIWGVVTVVFFVTRILGDPAVLLLPVGASEAQIQALRAALGLDQTLPTQYLRFLIRLLHGDFGTSFSFDRPALVVVLERMPKTIELAAAALLIGTLIGAAAGGIAALKRGTSVELAVMAFALIGQATPVFWLGIMLILLFAVDLGWLPIGGADGPRNLLLPAATLGVFVAASIARLFRSGLLDTMGEDFVRTARAKGVFPAGVFVRHIARNALIPVVTMIGIITGELLGGSVVTETVFAWPGVGRLIVQAIQDQDFPVVQAGVALISSIFVLINLLIDFSYRLLDPRIGAAG